MEKQAAAKQATTNAPAATAAPAVSTCLTRNTFDNGAVKFRGGALIVYDPLIDDRRRVRAHALLSSLNMLIETAGGFEYTAAQCREWMSHVGFRDIRTQLLDDVHTAVIGIKGDR